MQTQVTFPIAQNCQKKTSVESLVCICMKMTGSLIRGEDSFISKCVHLSRVSVLVDAGSFH